MALPNKTNLQTMDIALFGAPFVNVAASASLNLDGLDVAYLGQPFWAVGGTSPTGISVNCAFLA